MWRRRQRAFASNDDFYAAVRALIDDLRAADEGHAADRLNAHMTGGATSSNEVFGELRIELRALLRSEPGQGQFTARIEELLWALDDALKPRFF